MKVVFAPHQLMHSRTTVDQVRGFWFAFVRFFYFVGKLAITTMTTSTAVCVLVCWYAYSCSPVEHTMLISSHVLCMLSLVGAVSLSKHDKSSFTSMPATLPCCLCSRTVLVDGNALLLSDTS